MTSSAQHTRVKQIRVANKSANNYDNIFRPVFRFAQPEGMRSHRCSTLSTTLTLIATMQYAQKFAISGEPYH